MLDRLKGVVNAKLDNWARNRIKLEPFPSGEPLELAWKERSIEKIGGRITVTGETSAEEIEKLKVQLAQELGGHLLKENIFKQKESLSGIYTPVRTIEFSVDVVRD